MSSLRLLLKQHEDTVQGFLSAFRDSQPILQQMTDKISQQTKDIDGLKEKSLKLQQTLNDMTVGATSARAKSTGSVISVASTKKTWAEVCRQAPPSPTTLPDATIAIIDSILDRSMIQTGQPPRPQAQPAEQVEFYRNLSQIEIEHRIALLYWSWIPNDRNFQH
ncbi:hypothetical protein BJ741DRAFT_135814 [Chytriomyces cf. hyalinus JEL632]|nr:hypothetical protein BJ741DRAFT_135814 [Chytriomyces cf. hyalinus JEL632]